ncbi:MAG: prepilin-type N-terminal cleavage/methylation domain-containing protein [Desulfuromonadales bacterium]|nr:prepilin-type N-terminal cleavage/methylation domain-containing protein [Desulfuromonadales bacterium]
MLLPEKPMNTFKNNDKGFSLVEVLFALFIFAVGILAVALMLDTSIQKNSSARLMSEATEIAQYQMEKLMSVSYHDAGLNESSSPYGPNTIGNYNVSWTVREDLPMSDMKTINLTVAWNDLGKGKSLTVDAIRQ